MFKEKTHDRLKEVQNRIEVFAHHAGSAPAEVASLKLRPIQFSPAIDDKLAYESQDYTTPLVYADVGAECKVTPVSDELASRLNRQYKAYWIDLAGHRLLWIENETGLEIIGAIAALCTIGVTIYQVFNIVRNRLKEKTQADGPNPPPPSAYTPTTKIRTQVEMRFLDSNGILREQRITQQCVSRGQTR
jgi:hypothetical protein